MKYKVNVGDPIPAFKVKDNEGYELTENDLLGSPLVIYFYPKDDTPGCTKEACSFRDTMDQFDALDVLVIGISPDKKDSHEKFTKKFDLNFTLLTDENQLLSKSFGVPQGPSGLERTTFVIDGDGIIRWIERPVDVNGHVERVMEALQEIQASSDELS